MTSEEQAEGLEDLSPSARLGALGLELPPVCEGNAYVGDYEHVPTTLAQARDLLAGSAIARGAFGDDVVDHYVNAADVELAAFNSAVTDWERVRGFERL